MRVLAAACEVARHATAPLLSGALEVSPLDHLLKNARFQSVKLVRRRWCLGPTMAPAAVLSLVPVQMLCTSCSSTKSWQQKNLVSAGAALNRASVQGNEDMASVMSSPSVRRLFSVFRRPRSAGLGWAAGSVSSRHVFTEAVEGSIAADENESSAAVNVTETAEQTVESPLAAGPPPEGLKQKIRREDPTVPTEALVEGAEFTGKVVTIMKFGAFVSFGAFTDGLVHISRLSNRFVSNVGDIVKLGQEVKVRITSVDFSSGRIALSMLDKEDERPPSKRGGFEDRRERFRSQPGPEGRLGGDFEERRERFRPQPGPDGRSGGDFEERKERFRFQPGPDGRSGGDFEERRERSRFQPGPDGRSGGDFEEGRERFRFQPGPDGRSGGDFEEGRERFRFQPGSDGKPGGEFEEGRERSRFQPGPDVRPVNRERFAGVGNQDRRDDQEKFPTKLSNGPDVEGYEKNKIGSGVGAELPENGEGFLRYSNTFGGEKMAREASLQTGEKTKPIVQRTDRGKIIPALKPGMDANGVNRDTSKGNSSFATNPFVIALMSFDFSKAQRGVPLYTELTRTKSVAAPKVAAVLEEVNPEAVAPAVKEFTPGDAPAQEKDVAGFTIAAAKTSVAEKDVLEAVASVVKASPAEEEAVADVIKEATAVVVEVKVPAVEKAPVAVEVSTVD